MMNAKHLDPKTVDSLNPRELMVYIKELILKIKLYPVQYTNEKDIQFIAGVMHHSFAIANHELLKNTAIAVTLSDSTQFNGKHGFISIGKIICELNDVLFYLISNYADN